MNDYVELRLDMQPFPGSDATDLMAALLADIGYESFVPDESGLTAYIKAEDYDEAALKPIADDFPFVCGIELHSEFIAGRDWNAEWERNYFKPIVIDDKVVIHSTFHTDVPVRRYDIVIDPKMAFGTGHHFTTRLMVDALLDMSLDGAVVIDMGTGTGVLAILASMLGAADVTGIEIDRAAYENAIENVRINASPDRADVKLICGDAAALDAVAPADVFLANINRNVITADLPRYAAHVKSGGTMVLSGFYEQDIAVIEPEAERSGFKLKSYKTDNNWACMRLVRV